MRGSAVLGSARCVRSSTAAPGCGSLRRRPCESQSGPAFALTVHVTGSSGRAGPRPAADGTQRSHGPLPEDCVAGFLPFVQAGVGGARYTADYDDRNARDRVSDVALNFAVGGDLQLSRVVGLRLMARDYVTSFEWDRPGDVTSAILGGRTAHHWALTVGLNIGLGR